MKPPMVSARLDRRILVNYRVDPEALAAVLPAPFSPLLIGGSAIAGICLIRLRHIRPTGLPAVVRLTTENAAHRMAVQWDTADGPAAGVYIPRRDTSSRLTALVGGRMFPGWHHRAKFTVEESDTRFAVRVEGRDGGARVVVAAHLADEVMAGSVFGDVESASRFFGSTPVGYSASRAGAALDGVELDCRGWNLEPLALDVVESSFFDDVSRFPPGTVALDSAFLMRNLDTVWSALPRLAVLADAGE